MNKILFVLLFSFLQITGFAQNHDAELINQKTNIVIDKNKLTKEVLYEIRINNRAGEKYTRITIPFSKLYRVSNIDAHIENSNGKIVKRLKKSDIVERSSISDFSLYEDDFIKDFTLKHNSYPYTIVYSYKIQQKEFLYIDYWMPVLSDKVPTLKANLEITVPVDYTIKYLNHSVNEPSIDTLSNKITSNWHASYTDIMKQEVFSPDISTLLPAVSITPTDFYFEKKGSFENWMTYGNWQHDIMLGLSELPENEKMKILSITENIEDEKEKIKVLYHSLQDETRYINISIGTGGMKPYHASYVVENKYGDCKALTNYFKSVLDFLEIESYYTTVYAGTPTKHIDKSFPSQQFNHVILYIPSDDKDIWLDATSDGPFDYLGTFTQNRDAFVVDFNQSRFVKTPSFSNEDVLETRHINVEYASNQANVSFRNRYKGDMYEKILHIETDYNESDKSRILQSYFVEDGFEMKNHQIIKSNRDSANIELILNATSQEVYRHYGNDILISNIAFELPKFEKPKDRKSPIQIDYPIYKIDTLIYTIPKGFELNQSFKNFAHSNRFGEYKLNINENEGEIIVIKSLQVYAGHYPITDYQDFYGFFETVLGIENKKQLVLNKLHEND